MKRLILAAVTVLACVAAWQAIAYARNHAQPDGDLTGDMATLLKYSPTDADTHGGKVRRAVDPVR